MATKETKQNTNTVEAPRANMDPMRAAQQALRVDLGLTKEGKLPKGKADFDVNLYVVATDLNVKVTTETLVPQAAGKAPKKKVSSKAYVVQKISVPVAGGAPKEWMIVRETNGKQGRVLGYARSVNGQMQMVAAVSETVAGQIRVDEKVKLVLGIAVDPKNSSAMVDTKPVQGTGKKAKSFRKPARHIDAEVKIVDGGKPTYVKAPTPRAQVAGEGVRTIVDVVRSQGEVDKANELRRVLSVTEKQLREMAGSNMAKVYSLASELGRRDPNAAGKELAKEGATNLIILPKTENKKRKTKKGVVAYTVVTYVLYRTAPVGKDGKKPDSDVVGRYPGGKWVEAPSKGRVMKRVVVEDYLPTSLMGGKDFYELAVRGAQLQALQATMEKLVPAKKAVAPAAKGARR